MKPLSFIIITYNRPDDMLALARNIRAMESAAELLEEVIIVNNASQSDYGEVEAYLDQQADFPFRYVRSDVNLGVAKGRNHAIGLGSAPILIMLDDDAEMQDSDCLLRLMEEFSREDTNRPKAIISFKVLYFEGRSMQVNAFPHKDFKRYRDKSFLETYYYAGGAHAISRKALEKAGTYPEDFFYGMEEYDLSYRLIEAGYSITYSDRIVMLHKESPLGRQPNSEKRRMMWVNKSKVAWRYLPLPYFFSTVFMWSIEYLRRTGFDLKGFLKGWLEAASIPASEKRTPVGRSALDYLRKVHARLWY